MAQGSGRQHEEQELAQRTKLLEAVRQDGFALQHASERHRADKAIVLQAVKQHGHSLHWASDELRADKEVVLAAVKTHGYALKEARSEPRADKPIVLEAVRQDGTALHWASLELRGDQEIVLEALKQDVQAFQWASLDLRADADFVLEAAKWNGLVLEWADRRLRADYRIVAEAVKTSGVDSLQFASRELETNKDLLLLATRSPGSVSTWKLSLDAQTLLSSPAFAEARASALAAKGEDAPILTVTSTHAPDEEQGDEKGAGAGFWCTAILMSGKSFECSLPAGIGPRRRCPTLSDLAGELVEGLRTYREAADRVFLNFVTSDDSDAIAVTPWDWGRPLSEFLPVSGEATLSHPQEECQAFGLLSQT